MDRARRPRAFISYRHTEHEDDPADSRNAMHRSWVETFVADLGKWNVEPVFDGHIRDAFRQYTQKDLSLVPFLAEFSAITSLICHAFIPILTPSYIERLGYGGYERQNATRWSFVLEEWHFAMHYANAGVMQYIPIVRAGEPERIAALPLGVGPENAFDMRDPVHYQHQVRFIAERLHQAWDGEPPLIDLSVSEWLVHYVAWCREHHPGCSEQRVDCWQVDAVRPRLFLDHLLTRFRERSNN
jgi:hypothetical protein